MAYPAENTDDADNQRAQWWLRRVNYAHKKMEPFVRAGKYMRKLYENEPGSEREQLLEEFFPDPANRTKASLVFGYVDQAISNSNARNPKFTVRPGNKAGVGGESVVGAVLNDYWRISGQKHQDDQVLADAYLCPFALCKLGWTEGLLSDESQSAFTDLIIDDPDEEILVLMGGEPTKVLETHDHEAHIKVVDEALEADDDLSEDAKDVMREHRREHRIFLRTGSPDTHTDVERQAPFGIRWPMEDVAIDWMATDGLRDAAFVAFRVTERLEKVKSNPLFSQKARDLLTPSGRQDDTPGETDLHDSDWDLVTYWEIWAKDFLVSPRRRINLLAVVAEGQKDEQAVMLRHERWPYRRLKDYPAEMLQFNRGVGKHWLSTPFLMKAGMDNATALMHEILDSILSTIRKDKNVIFYDSDVIGADEATAAVKSSKDIAIPLPGLSKVGQGAFATLDKLRSSPEKMPFLDMVLGLTDRIAGTPQPGISTQDDTATEVAINERKISAREDRRDDLFEEYQVRKAEKFWAMITQYKPDRLFLIDPRAQEWATVTDGIVRGQYRFEIDVASKAVATIMERRQWQDIMGQAVGLVEYSNAVGLPPPNIPAIFEKLMVRGFDEQSPEDLWPAVGMEGLNDMLSDPETMQKIALSQERLKGGAPTKPGQNGSNGFTPRPNTDEVDLMAAEVSGA